VSVLPDAVQRGDVGLCIGRRMCRDCRVFVGILRLVFVLTGTSIASSVFGHSSVVGAGEVSGRNVLHRALFRCNVQDAARKC